MIELQCHCRVVVQSFWKTGFIWFFDVKLVWYVNGVYIYFVRKYKNQSYIIDRQISNYNLLCKETKTFILTFLKVNEGIGIASISHVAGKSCSELLSGFKKNELGIFPSFSMHCQNLWFYDITTVHLKTGLNTYLDSS